MSQNGTEMVAFGERGIIFHLTSICDSRDQGEAFQEGMACAQAPMDENVET